MSNEEKIKIETYKKKRKKLIIIQASILAFLSIVLIVLFGSYQSINQVSYINYNESSVIDYKVSLKNNDLFEEDELGKDYAYVSSLINNVNADFKFEIEVEEDASFDYSYYIDAKLVIIDKTTNKEIYQPIYPVVEEKTGTVVSTKLQLSEKITIDYNLYNQEVINFVRSLNLNSTTSKLVLTATYNVTSTCGNKGSSEQNIHSCDLIVPLNENVIKISESNTALNQGKVFACEKGSQKNVLIGAMSVNGGLVIISGLALLIYTLFTRNNHINYSNKVERIVKSYKSFIQKINNAFDLNSYQILKVDTINELLEIRDLVQAPILMYENEDKTKTEFIIPSENKLAYIHEIKIENYDEIYKPKEVNIEKDEDNKEEPKEIKTSYGHNYSFEAKLSLSKEEIKNQYLIISKFVQEYGVKITRSYKKERIHLGRNLIANIVFKGKTMCILFAIDPNKEEYQKYKLIDMSEYSKYEETPSMMRITSSRKVKYAIEILEKLFVENNIKDKNLVIKEQKIKTKSKKSLLKEGLIKVNN